MRLTEKKTIEQTVQIWEGRAKNGCKDLSEPCPLCKYASHHCHRCPYGKVYGSCCEDETYYLKWVDAMTPKTRKKYATLLLEQLRTL